MAQDPTTAAPARRIFIYGDHRFDDPGAAYTVDQIRTHLTAYFPELAHATTEEKTLPDGTVEITFRKQVAHKGSGDAGRLKLLLDELERIPPYDDPLSELTAALGSEPLTLAAILDVQELLQAQASDVYGLAGRAEQVVKRCLTLPPSPLAQRTPHGF
jgi:PRTRC genetic system protein C